MEIKRYGLGAKAEKLTDESVQFGLMGIVERHDGEYYKASDIDAYLEVIGAGGVTGSIDALDAIIEQCEKISNRLGIKDHQEALLEGDLGLANALRASAWEVSLIGTLAKNLKEKIPEKTIEEHRAEFEQFANKHYFLSELPIEFDGEEYSDGELNTAWESFQAARGLTG